MLISNVKVVHIGWWCWQSVAARRLWCCPTWPAKDCWLVKDKAENDGIKVVKQVSS